MNWLAMILVMLSGTAGADIKIGEPLRYLPVQDAGRLKPYDTFAREALELIYGRAQYEGGRDAVEVVTTWMIIPDQWDREPIIQITHSGVREALKLDSKRLRFSPAELVTNERIALVFQELRSKRESGDKLNPYFQDVQRLENQLNLYHAIKLGMALRVVPQATSDTWLAAAELTDPLKAQMTEVTTAFVKAAAASGAGNKAEAEEKVKTLSDKVKEFILAARNQAPDKYADDTKIRAEVHYNSLHPFRWSWIFYLIGAMFLVSHLVSGRQKFFRFGFVALVAGLCLHTYGMALRSYLSGRPPVSNMFETVVWVPWGTLIFALILERAQRNRWLLACAAFVAIFCLILTDLAPTVLDESIHPLEPVLRSTFWLTTHVLIITISYAAFFLAFAMGDLLLFYYLKDEKRYAKPIQMGAQSIYRSIQIGVVLLAAGIILGGIWADYSWGRFWGWDPKETWALIALLGYLALLHARLVGWVRAFGMAAWSVVAFSLVIMAWYGVNFVLGAGLHSYGFGAGGVEYVAVFVAIHLLYVTFVATVRRSRLKAGAIAPSKK